MHSAGISLEQRIKAFSKLGKAMRDGAADFGSGSSQLFSQLIDSYEKSNPWFTPDNVRLAVSSLGENLTTDNITKWLSRYPALTDFKESSIVGVVMAGNIPLVGFHDLLCVLITGNRLIAKPSTKDDMLVRAVVESLIDYEPGLSDCITISSDKLSGFDMVIATGSDNTSRYFDYYFRNYHSLIRKNRNSVAILKGNETLEELEMLGEDIFAYFGLGCRSVSKLYLPAGFDINRLTNLWNKYRNLRSHHKYAVNYDHNKAILIVNKQPFTDTGFLLLRQNQSLTPPMAMLYYDFYSSEEDLRNELETRKNAIQCIAGCDYIPFGRTQHPKLWDYADDVDTILFLLKKNNPR